jgi:hypothetical protein
MVLRKNQLIFQERKTSRNILAYFFDSKLWTKYKKDVVDNDLHWIKIDPDRGMRMYAASLVKAGYKGYTVQELIYDIMGCIINSKLKDLTKAGLFIELNEFEKYHINNDSLNTEL